jgi:hypothetical protein
MKIKARLNKIHRVNPNGILCDSSSLDKLRSGEVVDVAEEVASELLNMGFVEKAVIKKSKKGVK